MQNIAINIEPENQIPLYVESYKPDTCSTLILKISEVFCIVCLCTFIIVTSLIWMQVIKM